MVAMHFWSTCLCDHIFFNGSTYHKFDSKGIIWQNSESRLAFIKDNDAWGVGKWFLYACGLLVILHLTLLFIMQIWCDVLVRILETEFGRSFIDRFVVARIESHDESMITVGLELTNFIDPNLTWKTVSKGRNTSKRSRKPISKFLELDKDQEKKQFQRLSGTHSLESDKSCALAQRRGFGNMEHVPIKKRRFFLRSPSPPPQSPKHCEESKELDSGRSTLEQQTYANGNTENEVTGVDFSESLCKNSVTDNNIENTASPFIGVPVSNEDFSGISMLAAAACSSGLDCSVGDVEKSTIGDSPKRDDNESFASATILKENIAISKSTDSLGEAAGQPMEEDRVANLPIDSTEQVCLKSSNEDGSSLTNELLRAKPTESVVSTISREASVERCGSSDAINNVVRPIEDKPSDSSNEDMEIADKTVDTFVPRKYWDLNTIMDEWGHPIEDTFAGSCVQSVEVAPTNNTSLEKSLDVEKSLPEERVLVIESGERVDGQTVACAEPVSKALSDSGEFPGAVSTFNKSESSLGVSTDLLTSSLKGNCSLHGTDNHAVETTSACVIKSKSQRVAVAEADSDIDKDLKNLINSKGQSSFRTEVHEIDSSLVPLSENTSCEVKAVDCGFTDSKEKNSFDENDEGISLQSGSTNFLGASNSNIAAMSPSPSGDILCKANDIGSGNYRPQEQIAFVDANVNKSLETAPQLVNTQSFNFETPLVKLKVSDVAHSSSNMEAVVAPSATIRTSITSELFNSNANAAQARGYDCHLEDGELREPVGHGWEDNEVEDIETEHVDYDSDDREGIIFEDPNDSVQLSGGDALVGDCEKQSRGLDKSVDVESSLQHQSSLSTVDAKMTDSFKRDSPLLKPCLRAPLEGEDRVEGDCTGASVSADSIRSRSSNFDGMHHANCPSVKHKPLVQTDLCCDPSQNVEEVRDRVYQPRNISAPRSGYNSMRRGSSGDRDNFHGTRMGNSRDNTLDSNSRNKFDRFSGGINRGFREGYHRPGTFNNSGEGRRRSFSPRDNRQDSHYPRSHQKSRSRSRTRSPDYRPEARMGRARLPYQQPGHSGNYIRGGRSASRGRGFNQRPRFDNTGSPGRLRPNDGPMRFHDTSRDPDYEENNQYRRKPLFIRNDRRSRSRSRSFSPDYRPNARGGSMRGGYQPTGGRGRRSSPPVRGFRQFQRYDNNGESPGERFNDNSQSSRGNDYDNGGNVFRRKPRNIFERIHPRHHDEDGDNRRFQYDDQDNNNNNQNFRRNENYGRGGGRRPMDFRREDRGNNNNNNVRYDSDRMFDSGPKQFRGMRGS